VNVHALLAVGVWIDQLEGIARKVRRRQLALLVDTCEWMYVFDESNSGEEEHQPRSSRPVKMSPWLLGQVLPRLLATAPKLKVILAGWDRLEIDAHRIPSLPACELTGWDTQHTQSFLTSAGVDDPAVAALVHQAGDGLPLLATVVAEEATRWRTADGFVDAAALSALIQDRPAHRWVPEMILDRLSAMQQDELAAAAVLRVITRPALQALLPDHPHGEDWFHRLTSRTFLQQLPSTATNTPAGAPKWQMHGLIRRWMLDYLADEDALRPASDRRLPGSSTSAPQHTSPS
jgi:hypothetical protein